MKKILLDCTFIIPVKIDSYDRKQNFKFVINYLVKNFETNIIITETSETEELFLNNNYNNFFAKNNIKLIEKKNEKVFHRTRYLNEMLNMVQSKITVNYDVDVFLPVSSYLEAVSLILNDKKDLVYPYSRGWYQYMIPQSYRDEILNKEAKSIELNKLNKHTAEFGHLQFFNTASYKKGFGENEDFISYGPEDKERYFRFNKLGYDVCHMGPEKYVFHLEHHRGKDSGHHDNYESNETKWEYIKTLSRDKLLKYYENKSGNLFKR